MKRIMCTQCGVIIKSLAQANEQCEEKPLSKGSHSLWPSDMAVLTERETKKVARAKGAK